MLGIEKKLLGNLISTQETVFVLSIIAERATKYHSWVAAFSKGSFFSKLFDNQFYLNHFWPKILPKIWISTFSDLFLQQNSSKFDFISCTFTHNTMYIYTKYHVHLHIIPSSLWKSVSKSKKSNFGENFRPKVVEVKSIVKWFWEKAT